MELEGELWVWAKTNSVITVEYLKIFNHITQCPPLLQC